MKCPECGKELTENDVYSPIFSKDGKILGHSHCSKQAYAEAMEICQEYNLDGYHTFYALQIESFMKAFDEFKKNHSEKEMKSQKVFDAMMQLSVIIFFDKLKELNNGK